MCVSGEVCVSSTQISFLASLAVAKVCRGVVTHISDLCFCFFFSFLKLPCLGVVDPQILIDGH